jgi:hypothetical protein
MKTMNHDIARENNRLLFVAHMESLATEASEDTRIAMAVAFLKRKEVLATDYIECFESDYERFINIRIGL